MSTPTNIAHRYEPACSDISDDDDGATLVRSCIATEEKLVQSRRKDESNPLSRFSKPKSDRDMSELGRRR